MSITDIDRAKDLARVQIGLTAWEHGNFDLDEATGNSTALLGFVDTLRSDLNVSAVPGLDAALTALSGLLRDGVNDTSRLTDADSKLTEIGKLVGLDPATAASIGSLNYMTLSCMTLITIQQDICASVLNSVQAASAQKQQMSQLLAALQAQRPASTSAAPFQLADDAAGCSALLLQMQAAGLIPTLLPHRASDWKPSDAAAGKGDPQYLGLISGQDSDQASSYRIVDTNGDGIWDMSQANYDFYIGQLQSVLSESDQSQQQSLTTQSEHHALSNSLIDFLSKMVSSTQNLMQAIFNGMR